MIIYQYECMQCHATFDEPFVTYRKRGAWWATPTKHCPKCNSVCIEEKLIRYGAREEEE
jgi:NAD-dependent SIR2 family protein deacetylase